MKKFFTTLVMLAAMVGMNAQDNVWILGNVGDQGWDPSVGTQMEYVGDATYEYQGHFNASSYFSFTTMLAETSSDWDAIRPYRFGAEYNDFSVESLLGEPIACGDFDVSADNAFLITKAADYKITLIMEEDSRLVMIERLSEPDPVEPPTPGGIFILGAVNGNSWEPSVGVKMDSIANNTFVANVSIVDSVANFSFTHALATTIGDWASISEYRFAALEGQNEVVLGEAMPLSDDGVSEPSFSLVQGYYTITLDMNARTMTVVAAQKEDAMYIIGNEPFGNWDPANPMKMTKNGNVYTAEATINGDVWFIFSDDFGSWDAVNARRFGPESADEDQVVNPDEQVTTQLSTGGKSYKITGNGDYVITFDKENLTFQFTTKGAGKLGDLNGDDAVDVDDMNIIINIMLGKAEKTAAADLNGDDAVDVDDMNIIINIMLGKA